MPENNSPSVVVKTREEKTKRGEPNYLYDVIQVWDPEKGRKGGYVGARSETFVETARCNGCKNAFCNIVGGYLSSGSKREFPANRENRNKANCVGSKPKPQLNHSATQRAFSFLD